MSFGSQMKKCREELGLSRMVLAQRLGISVSAVSNYENDLSFPKEDVILRLFDELETDPNNLFRDSFHFGGWTLSRSEQQLLECYRGLSALGRETIRSVAEALCAYRDEAVGNGAERETRSIPLYRTPAAVGYASPVLGEDFEFLCVVEDVPRAAEYAVRMQGDSMEPWIRDQSVVYVNRDPLRPGDVGFFCVDGDMLCRQYDCDSAGTVSLFCLNRDRAQEDLVLPPGSGCTLACLGRVIFRAPPLPGEDCKK